MILFVCTGNTCRSPMAEALLRKKLADNNIHKEVKSAGVAAYEPTASYGSINAMKNYGVDIMNHIPTLVTKELVQKADLILTMTNTHKHNIIKKYEGVNDKIFALKEYVHGTDEDVMDPFGGSIEIYMSTAKELKDLIDNLSIDKL